MKIYNLGSLNIDYVYSMDHFVSAGETLSSTKMEIFPGGKGLNQSVALAKAGAKVIHGAIVGDSADLLLDTLGAAGVDISRIGKTSGSCGHAIIQVDKNGQNCIILFAGTNHCLDKAYVESFLADAEENDILVLQNEVNGLDMIFAVAHEKKMQIAFNPSPFHTDICKLPLSYVKWWFCNEIEGAALFGSEDPAGIAEAFKKQYPESCLILTLGQDGSMFVDANICVKQPIYKVKAVDTTAAGDTFSGYFIAAIAQGRSVEYALDIAAKASSITVSRPGASSSIPALNEVV